MERSGFNIIKFFIAAFFVIAVLLPLGRMLAYIGGADFLKVIYSPQFGIALKNSLCTTAVATVIAICIATALAWCVTRTAIRFKGVLSVVLTLPMLIPSISHGMGLIILLGANGLLTRWLQIDGSIYGFWGVVIGSVMYSFPVAFLMVADVLRYEDSTSYEAASVLGIPKIRQFTAITAPYLRRPMIAIVFAVFTMIITDYGVPLMVGGKCTTLPVLMYQEVIGLLDFGKGSVIGAFLLIPAVIAFVIDLMNADKGNNTFITKAFDIKPHKLRDSISYAFCILIIMFVALPILAFVLLTFATKYPIDLTVTMNNIYQTLQLGGSKYLLNSVVIAFAVSLIGIVVSYITAYCTARLPSNISTRFLHLISITSLAIPGIVLGLSYALFFSGSFIYGTVAMLIMVNMVHFFASPYLMMYNTFGKLNENLEAVGMTLGISRLRMIKDVFLPQTKATILEMFSYFFVNCMMTISAVAFLANTATKPISLMITQFEAQMLLECAAFVSLLILAVNMLIKGFIYLAKRKIALRG